MQTQDVIPCASEVECLTKFKEALNKLDPDIITGWNVIDFDLNYLKKKFKQHKIKFDIGRTNAEPKIRIESGFFRASSVDIPGRQVLDGLTLIKDPFIKEAPTIKHAEFESYTLEDVAVELLGNGKLMKGKNRHKEIEQCYTNHTQDSLQYLADYNLMDCKLVYQILRKTDIIKLSMERSKLNGLPLDRLTGSIAAFDSLYIREAHKRRLVSSDNALHRKRRENHRGYV
jgi:DNA polymerase-2